MKYFAEIKILIVIATIFILLYSFAFADTRVSVKVVDENGSPVNQADVTIGFRHIRAKLKGWENVVDYHPAKGQTDRDGIFSSSDDTSPNVVINVTKEGFYESIEGVPFNQNGETTADSIRIMLKKKRNPIPMYAKKTDWLKIPVFNQPIGYDLQVGDWAPPYGSGKVNDFIFNFALSFKDVINFSMSYTLSFSNPEDGIIQFANDNLNQSVYKWPFTAPLTHYLSEIKKHRTMDGGKLDTDINKEIKYIFRVRAQTDKEGNIIGAIYGKMKGDIEIGRGDSAQDGGVNFSYYINPDGKNNLEFDTEKNLFIPEGAEKWKSEYQNYTGFEP